MINITSRQKLILKDLENSQVPITAKFLSAKYGVSIRTIRSDVDILADYVKENHAKFVRIPGLGMRILSTASLSDKLSNNYSFSEFSVLAQEARNLLLLLAFLFYENPIRLEDLADMFAVSKGTITNEIRKTNEYLKSYDIQLEGIRNKGIYLKFKKENLVKLNEEIMNLNSGETLYNTIFSEHNNLLDSEEKVKVSECLDYISNNLFLFVTHFYRLSYLIAIFVQSCRSNYENARMIYDDNKISKLAMFLEYKFDIIVHKDDLAILTHIMNYCTDYAENASIVDSSIELITAIDAMISDVGDTFPEIIAEKDNLRIDLLKHLKCSIDRNNLGIENTNPLLQEIKAFHYDEFKAVSDATNAFKKHYDMLLDENEISYLTLYFRRALEKTQKIQEAKVMVVCNTGRGASKLLATRIMNNFPEIHIVAMKSYIDIAKDQNILDNIDLIISTIPLPKIDKPWVVVSPFLQESELTKIKEIIWVGKGQRGTAENDHFDDLVDSVIKQYKNYQDAEAFTKKVDTLLSSRYLWSNIYENDSSEQYAKVIMEIFELLSRIYPVGLNSDQFSLVSGLIAHVIMSVPRWQRGKFITAPDYHELTLKYPQEYKMISDSLQRIAKMLDIYIDDIESIAVLRYIIF